METIAFNFALNLQEKTKGSNFVSTLEEMMKENIDKIDYEKSTQSVLAFIDGSGCEFAGHNIKLIDKL